MCYPFYDNGQCEKPQIVERVIIRIPALFYYNHYSLLRVSEGILHLNHETNPYYNAGLAFRFNTLLLL